MANERKTENIVRDFFRKNGYYDDKSIVIEEQKSDYPRIDKLLSTASKKGKGKGYPEFIVRSEKYSNFIIVIECKADANKHESENRDKYSDYAIDGVLLYSTFLSKEFDVLSIAVSGESTSNLRISQFIQLKSNHKAHLFLGNSILTFDEYFDAFIKSDLKFNQDYLNLLDYTKELNDLLHAKKIKESQRSLLISGILIALQNIAFKDSFSAHQRPKQLSNNLLSTIADEFSNANLPIEKVANLKQAYSFILTNTTLITDKDFFISLIYGIEENVNNFIHTHKYFDTLGQFYIEFLRYANSDKGLGIVLTPPHITDLFSDLAVVDKDSIIYDNCMGTGGFLISAMKKMIKDAKGNKTKIENIKKNQLIGTEYQDDIYALGISNMIIHGDGKTNVTLGDCFQLFENTKKKHKPTVGFLNPPYKSKKTDIEELDFVINNLNSLEKGSCCIAIVPLSCAIAIKGEVAKRKKTLLQNHTVDAIMSLPEDLFHNSKVNVVTCIFVLKAHIPHSISKKTWFGYWRNDGFVKVKNKGRIDLNDNWQKIRDNWLSAYHNKDGIAGHSIKRKVKQNDEWCAEAYMITDYSALTNLDWTKTIRKFLSYQFSKNLIDEVNPLPIISMHLDIQETSWAIFRADTIFNLHRGLSSSNLNIFEDKEGVEFIPYLRPSNNYSIHNGYLLKTEIDDDYIFSKLTLAMGNTGAGSHTYTYLIGEEFVPNNNITVLIPKKEINIYQKIFLINIIEHNRYRYNYGRIPSNNRFSESMLGLPIDKNGNPDWEFMDKFIKTLPYSSSLDKV